MFAPQLCEAETTGKKGVTSYPVRYLLRQLSNSLSANLDFIGAGCRSPTRGLLITISA